MGNIFNMPFANIRYSDIEHLVNTRVAENQCLEYKRETPKKQNTGKINTADLAEEISAFANTFGGFLIIGVEAEHGSNLPKKLVNVSEENLEDTVDNICLDCIQPPVVCDRKYVISNENGQRVFVVKIPESDLTPHAVRNNTAVYVRAMAQKRPTNDPARLERIDWLKERRQKYIEYRERSLSLARDRTSERLGNWGAQEIELEISLCPVYPRAALVEVYNIREFVEKLCVSYFSKWAVLPQPLQWVSTAQGVLATKAGTAYDVGHQGVALIKRRMVLRNPSVWSADAQRPPAVNLGEVFQNVLHAAHLLSTILDNLEHRGSLQLSTRLTGIKGKPFYVEGNHYPDDRVFEDNECVYQSTYYEGSVHSFVLNAVAQTVARVIHLAGTKSGVIVSAENWVSNLAVTFGWTKSRQQNKGTGLICGCSDCATVVEAALEAQKAET